MLTLYIICAVYFFIVILKNGQVRDFHDLFMSLVLSGVWPLGLTVLFIGFGFVEGVKKLLLPPLPLVVRAYVARRPTGLLALEIEKKLEEDPYYRWDSSVSFTKTEEGIIEDGRKKGLSRLSSEEDMNNQLRAKEALEKLK